MFFVKILTLSSMPKRIRPHVNPLAITKEFSFSGFGNDRPIIIDVGACKGEFIEALIEKFLEKNFIVFEIRVSLAEKLKAKFADHKNVVVFDGDAGRNFRSIIEPCQNQGALVEEIFINFPDPWFKEKHKKRRFINSKFLTDCAEWLDERTEFIFQTDQEFLFNETLEVIEASSYSVVEIFKKSPYGVQTDWEQAKTEEGNLIWRMRIRR